MHNYTIMSHPSLALLELNTHVFGTLLRARQCAVFHDLPRQTESDFILFELYGITVRISKPQEEDC